METLIHPHPGGKRTSLKLGRTFRAVALALPLIAAPLAVASAAEAGGGHRGPSEVVFLTQIILLLVCGRLMGEAMLRIRQPAVMGQLIAGILLGPSVLGALWPDLQHAIFPRDPEQKAMISAVSQLGILMLLLLTGMETDLSVVRKSRRAALSVSLTGIAIPFVCGFVLGEHLPEAMLPHPEQRLVTSLFLGTALSISSVKIVAMVVREMDFMRRTVGQVIVSSAIIDDTIGWIIMSVTFGLALHGGVDLPSVAQSVIGTALFLIASFTIGRRIVFFLIRWTNDNFLSDVPVITTILVVTGIMALITHAIGVHTVLGAFVAGILVGQSPILTRHIDEQLRGLIVALFMPVFFGLAGLSTDLNVLENPSLLLLSIGFIAIASIGKFTGAFLGGAFGGLSWRESLALGCGMNARGSTEVIVATLGLSMGALSQDLFTMIVAMAVVTTMAMPPMLRWALARLPLQPEEQARLEREEFEARGFVTQLERLLVGVDESANGRLASGLAGLLAGWRRAPTTVLNLRSAPTDADQQQQPEHTEEVETLVEASAGAAEARSAEAAAELVDITTRVEKLPSDKAIATEARKGYDFLIVGVEPVLTRGGDIHESVARMAAAFEGPYAIAVARGEHYAEPVGDAPLNILVPITGTEFSRRGAEVAIVLARASRGSVTAMHVAAATRSSGHTTSRRGVRRRLRAALGGSSTNEEAILRDAVRLGDQLDVPVRAQARVHADPDDAILRQLKPGRHNLVVMGVSSRPGTTLFFGNVPAAILARSDVSILLVAS
jgi:Kef-type K+ transport system membrane component KefB/nucleotide-binding universal stress UspA family protein